MQSQIDHPFEAAVEAEAARVGAEILRDRTRRAWRLGDLARAYGVSVMLLRREITEGRLPCRRVGRAIIVLVEDWERYLDASKGSEDAPA